MTLTAARCDYSRIHADGVKHDFRRYPTQHSYRLGIAGSAATKEAAIEATLKEGHMVGSGVEAAAISRKITKRPALY